MLQCLPPDSSVKRCSLVLEVQTCICLALEVCFEPKLARFGNHFLPTIAHFACQFFNETIIGRNSTPVLLGD